MDGNKLPEYSIVIACGGGDEAGKQEEQGCQSDGTPFCSQPKNQ